MESYFHHWLRIYSYEDNNDDYLLEYFCILSIVRNANIMTNKRNDDLGISHWKSELKINLKEYIQTKWIISTFEGFHAEISELAWLNEICHLESSALDSLLLTMKKYLISKVKCLAYIMVKLLGILVLNQWEFLNFH